MEANKQATGHKNERNSLVVLLLYICLCTETSAVLYSWTGFVLSPQTFVRKWHSDSFIRQRRNTKTIYRQALIWKPLLFFFLTLWLLHAERTVSHRPRGNVSLHYFTSVIQDVAPHLIRLYWLRSSVVSIHNDHKKQIWHWKLLYQSAGLATVIEWLTVCFFTTLECA